MTWMVTYRLAVLFCLTTDKLYGTTIYGGSTSNCGEGNIGCGVIFELTP